MLLFERHENVLTLLKYSKDTAHSKNGYKLTAYQRKLGSSLVPVLGPQKFLLYARQQRLSTESQVWVLSLPVP